MKVLFLSILPFFSLVIGACSSGQTARDVVGRYYTSIEKGDFNRYMSCLSPYLQEETTRCFPTAEAWLKAIATSQNTLSTSRIIRSEEIFNTAKVWVSEDKNHPEIGRVYFLEKYKGKWFITKSMVLAKYENDASHLDL